MKRFIIFLGLGVFFGVVLSKSEVISWYRIYEMFHFLSFHMYGIIGSAILFGGIFIFLLKKFNVKDANGQLIDIPPKQRSYARFLIGGTIFGLGWALSGACPAPMFILFRHGYYIISIAILSAILGTFIYGLVRDKLPH